MALGLTHCDCSLSELSVSPRYILKAPLVAAMAAHIQPELDFTSECFSPVQWVNSILSSAPSPSHLRQAHSALAQSPTLSTSVSPKQDGDRLSDDNLEADADITQHHDKLQQITTDAHAELDAALARALSAVPWAVREAEKVRQRATSLRAGVDGVGERVAGVEGAVSAAVAAIAEADTLVRRVEGSADLLRQASHADALLARLDSLLASSSADGSDLVSAADVVAELRASLEPLRAIPDLRERFGQLDTADQKLEALAAPRLKTALETRNAPAASNAKIVFDRAGRNNAFATKYVDIRAAQVASMWSAAWAVEDELPARGGDAKDPVSVGKLTEAGRVPDSTNYQTPSSLHLASTKAALQLDAFYADLFTFVQKEADWLALAFPDLRDVLLPSLISASLAQPVLPSLSALRPDPTIAQSSGMTRLHHASLRSTRAAWDFARILYNKPSKASGSPSHMDGSGGAVPAKDPLDRSHTAAEGTNSDGTQIVDVDDLARAVLDAVTSILFPSHIFWSSWPAMVARSAEVTAQGLPLNVPVGDDSSGNMKGKSAPVPLSDTAKAVEGCRSRLLALLDSLTSQISDWTGGVGVLAVPAVTAAASTAFSRRILALVGRDQTNSLGNASSEDDWAHVGGALRLLRAVSSLKQSWESRKETCVGAAAGPASSLVEIANSIKGHPGECLAQLLEWGEMGMWAEASAAFQLISDESVMQRAVKALVSIGDSSENDSSEDMRGLLDGVHRVVYQSMFIGIQKRFRLFDRESTWGVDSTEDSQDGSAVGFSSSPLAYATEVADYLMTIPQQLEPYVPGDDEDDGFATPSSVFAFSKRRSGHSSSEADSSTKVDAGEGTESDGPVAYDAAAEIGMVPSFAGMWIGAIAVGTMDLYTEKIAAIPRLSASAVRQLSTDAEYLCNVLAALGVTPTDEMDLVRRVLDCAADLASLSAICAAQETPELRRLVEKLALARGVPLSQKS